MNQEKTEVQSIVDSQPRRKRKWPVTAVGILLLFQALFLFAIFPVLLGNHLYHRPQKDLAVIFPPGGGIAPFEIEYGDLAELSVTLHFEKVTVPIEPQLLFSLLFATLSLPALVTGFLFLASWRHAWTVALFIQVLALSLALFAYFRFHHPYDYLVMFYSILLVFYLNYFEVQEQFRYPPPQVRS